MMLVTYNPTTKKVGISSDVSSEDKDFYNEVKEQVTQLNELSKQIIGHNPVPVQQPTKEISMKIKKEHEAGIQSLKSGKFEDAISHLNKALNIATCDRNKWEPFQVSLFETHLCLNARADAYLLAGKYDLALQDCSLLISTMNLSAETFYKRSVVFLQLGLLEEAKADLERGLVFAKGPVTERLLKQLQVVRFLIDVENGDLDEPVPPKK